MNEVRPKTNRYLRMNQRRTTEIKQPGKHECPYCRSKNIIKGERDTHCRNCFRHFY